jgi:hypothetical protein
MGKRSTWAFNVLRSDAVVLKSGETNSATIMARQGISSSSCLSLPPEKQQACLTAVDEFVNNTIANNKFGTATQLGGFSRLRSFPQGRYKGAHTLFYGTEFRWNLTDENTPFDIFVMKDVRTAFQLAFFYEAGSTADHQSDVGRVWRDTYGVGARMVTASGVVFRADLAFGREGFEPEIFIGYPWELQ